MQQLLDRSLVSSLICACAKGFRTHSVQRQTYLAEFLMHKTSSGTGLPVVQHTTVLLKDRMLLEAAP